MSHVPRQTRAAHFAAQKKALTACHLADPGKPYRQSGRSSGATRREATRRPLAAAIPRDGDLLDVGCANGLLLETRIGWCVAAGIAVRPHGVDLIPELGDLARARHAGHEPSFHLANAWDWRPPRRYDVVRTSLEHVPRSDWNEFVRRHGARRRFDSEDGRWCGGR